jgi:hypothetical protein
MWFWVIRFRLGSGYRARRMGYDSRFSYERPVLGVGQERKSHLQCHFRDLQLLHMANLPAVGTSSMIVYARQTTQRERSQNCD